MLSLKSEVQVKASFRIDVTVVVAPHWCPGGRPRPPSLLLQMKRPAASFLPPRCGVVSIFNRCFRFGTLHLRASLFPTNFCARLWAGHDVQEAEEGELQRAGDGTRLSGQRHLFPFVQVGQLQDGGPPDQQLRSLQLQNSGLLWWDSAQKLQEGNYSLSKRV